MSHLSINGGSPEPIQTGKNEQGNSTTITKYSNSIYTLVENGDGEVGWNDLQNEQNRGKNIADAARDVFRQIDKFFTDNKGKKWTNELMSKINTLLKEFNTKNKSDDERTVESYNEQGKMTGYTHYNANGSVSSTGEFSYDEYGNVRQFEEKDDKGNLSYVELMVRNNDGSYTKYSSVGDGVGQVFHEDETYIIHENYNEIIDRPSGKYREFNKNEIRPK